MGGIFSMASLGTSLACCCGSAACSLCCSSCPNCSNSVSSRLMYSLILLLTMIVSCILLSPGLENALKSVPFCNGSSSWKLPVADSGLFKYDCEKAIGYLSVYRLCFSVTLFFFLMALLMIGVSSNKDARAPIQNGFWGIKYLLIIGGAVGAFFISESGTFETTWMYFGVGGGFLFILIQLVLIIDFVHSWAEKWIEKGEENPKMFTALIVVTILFYIGVLVSFSLLYVYYTGTTSGQCKLHETFISINLLICLFISVLSVTPKIREKTETSILLQPALISLYIVYLTWSSLSSSPQLECKWNVSSIFSSNFTEVQLTTTTTTTSPTILKNNESSTSFDPQAIVGLVIWILCLIYSSLQTSLGGKESRSHEEEEEENNNFVSYNWSGFHGQFVCSTLYLMMTLTNWFQPNSNLDSFFANSPALWIKIVSSWVCGALYAWTLIAPVLFPDREFNRL